MGRKCVAAERLPYERGITRERKSGEVIEIGVQLGSSSVNGSEPFVEHDELRRGMQPGCVTRIGILHRSRQLECSEFSQRPASDHFDIAWRKRLPIPHEDSLISENSLALVIKLIDRALGRCAIFQTFSKKPIEIERLSRRAC